MIVAKCDDSIPVRDRCCYLETLDILGSCGWFVLKENTLQILFVKQHLLVALYAEAEGKVHLF